MLVAASCRLVWPTWFDKCATTVSLLGHGSLAGEWESNAERFVSTLEDLLHEHQPAGAGGACLSSWWKCKQSIASGVTHCHCGDVILREVLNDGSGLSAAAQSQGNIKGWYQWRPAVAVFAIFFLSPVNPGIGRNPGSENKLGARVGNPPVFFWSPNFTLGSWTFRAYP